MFGLVSLVLLLERERERMKNSELVEGYLCWVVQTNTGLNFP